MRKPLVGGLAVLWFLIASAALAQNLRSWVSSTGSDSNTCTRSAPCATFQGALGKTILDGEVDVVDPGDYGTVSITQPVTIDGGGMGRITGDFAVYVNGLFANVTIRNLTLNGGFASTYGIVIDSASPVTISNVQVSGYPTGLQAGGGVTVIDSTIQANTSAALNYGVEVTGGNTILIRNSTISANSVVKANSAGVHVISGGTATLDGVLVTNSGIGIRNESGGTTLLRNSTIMGNTTGLSNFGSGTIVSFVNNAIYNNGTNGAPTSSVFQK